MAEGQTGPSPSGAASAAKARRGSAKRIELVLVRSLLVVPLLVSIHAGFYFPPLPGYPADFAIFRTAASMARSGQGSVLYDVDAQQRAFREATDGRYPNFLIWNHPPLEALLYLPATLFSYERGWLIAKIINSALITILAVWAASRLGSNTGRLLVLWVVLLAALPFFASSITMGQDSMWILALLLASFVALSRKQMRAAGVLLGLASIKFTIALPLAGILLLCGFYEAAVTAAVVAVATLLAPALVLGWRVVPTYLSLCFTLTGTEGRWGLYPELLWNFRGLVRHWIDGGAAIGVTALAGLLYALLVRLAPRRLLPGLALFGATFFSPHVYRHDGVMHVGAAILLLLPSPSEFESSC
jgi:hypothetical protein